MKKFLAIAAIAGVMTACNNGGEGSGAGDTAVLTTPSVVDSITVDSTAVTPLVDTTATGTGATDTTTRQ